MNVEGKLREREKAAQRKFEEISLELSEIYHY